MTRDVFEAHIQCLLNCFDGTRYEDQKNQWVTWIKDHDAEQRATIEQQAKKIQELEDWQKIVAGTGTDQEAVVRMIATEYTKVAVQCWKEKCEQQAQEIALLREALQAIVSQCEDEDWEYMFGDTLKQAQQALKETS